MGSFPFISTIFLCFAVVSCSNSSSGFIYPKTSASGIDFIGGSVGFMTSMNGTFKAAMINAPGQETNFYLCVVHVASTAIIWSANRDVPVSQSGIMTLSVTGIVVTDQDGNVKWSTPPFNTSVSALQLTETGNLVLLDQSNATLWESFSYPTDTIVIGQKLPVGGSLSSALSSTDLSVGSYWLSVTASNVLLQWQNITYWTLSMAAAAYLMTTSSPPGEEYLEINQTGLYLFGNNGAVVVIQVNLTLSDFAIAKLDYSGLFTVSSLSGTDLNPVLEGPDDKCQMPFICGTLGLCTYYASPNNVICSCPSNFQLNTQSQNSTGCVPSDGSYSLSNSCNSTNNSTIGNSSSVSYLSLGYGVDYFATGFTRPAKHGVNLTACQDLCSQDCSCSAIFYDNSTNSCFILQNQLGSVMSSASNDDLLGFVKTIVGPSPANSGKSLGFPIVAIVLLPFIGIVLLAALGFFLWRRSTSAKTGNLDLTTLPSSEDLDAFSIPGLPVRFGYAELEVATDKFKTVIGSGGFGAVYKDRALFGSGPVLEWQQRVDIALGTARGLAYLHSGCQQKIIHCDVKPENILLHDNIQAKLSDFGLSKLLRSEQSGLFTTMRGTRGYLAPEWLSSSAVSDKSDVYSFGMVLLEIVSGRKNCSSQSLSKSKEDQSNGDEFPPSSAGGLAYFPMFALEMHQQGRYLELADPRLEGRVSSEDVEKLVRVALCCAHGDPALRPSMVSVVSMLEGEIPPGQPRLESLSFLRFYGHRLAEASTAEEQDGQDDFTSPLLNAPLTSSRGSLPLNISYIPSDEVYGPI
ncbi:hypothetical protein Vadar_032582 [Vaccinium darrowii]|uniref:Uncharacterized protein n=1 Tax=Vaccinium darrowii TaxID=229202 RepID=A0ACB7XV21_9ERIC|nr:hypothetical protein Vadar_032582 [Vaccinium darrowii]